MSVIKELSLNLDEKGQCVVASDFQQGTKIVKKGSVLELVKIVDSTMDSLVLEAGEPAITDPITWLLYKIISGDEAESFIFVPTLKK